MVDVDLSPQQPSEVSEAVSDLLELAGREPDPWWEAGIREALDA